MHLRVGFALLKKSGSLLGGKHGEGGRDGHKQTPSLIPPLVFWEVAPASHSTRVMPFSPLSCLSLSPQLLTSSSIRERWGKEQRFLLLGAASDINQQLCQVQGSSHLFSLFFLTVLIQQDFKHLLHPRVRGELNAQLCQQRACGASEGEK